jgi:hypothetical protein
MAASSRRLTLPGSAVQLGHIGLRLRRSDQVLNRLSLPATRPSMAATIPCDVGPDLATTGGQLPSWATSSFPLNDRRDQRAHLQVKHPQKSDRGESETSN